MEFPFLVFNVYYQCFNILTVLVQNSCYIGVCVTDIKDYFHTVKYVNSDFDYVVIYPKNESYFSILIVAPWIL